MRVQQADVKEVLQPSAGVSESMSVDGWTTVALGDPDVATNIMGQSPGSSTYNKEGIGLPFFQGKIDFGLRHPRPSTWCSSPLKIAEAGDILISVRAPVGDVNIATDKCCIGRGIAAVRSGAKAHNEFLFYSLLHHKPKLEAMGTGATFKAINKDTLYSFEVQLPPLAEQRAIAGVLAKIQKAVEIQEKIVARLKELKAATMAKLFREGLRGEALKQTEIGEIPESWAVVRMGAVCDKINYGTSVRCGSEKIGRPVLRIPNIINETVHMSDLKWATLPEREVAKLLLEQGDLVFVRTNGNKQYTGRCAVYQGQPEGALFASYLIRVRLSRESLLPTFAQAYVSSVGREQITSKAHPASDGKYNIDTGVLKSVLLPCPPLKEQETVVQIIDAIERRLRAAHEKAAVTKFAFSSMLHLLMTGQVRVTGNRFA